MLHIQLGFRTQQYCTFDCYTGRSSQGGRRDDAVGSKAHVDDKANVAPTSFAGCVAEKLEQGQEEDDRPNGLKKKKIPTLSNTLRLLTHTLSHIARLQRRMHV